MSAAPFEREHARVVAPDDPVARGHVEVRPKRDVSLEGLEPHEQADLDALVEQVRSAHPNALVTRDPHCVHVIPRSSHVSVPGRLHTGGAADPLWGRLRPWLARATDVSILAAFVRRSGVRTISPALRSALERQARVRVLTGDYLGLTESEALRDLGDLRALHETLDLRVVETASLAEASFHPKAWILCDPPEGVAYVGSSNLSRSALTDGLEWNLRVDAQWDSGAFREITEAFERLWERGRPVDASRLSHDAEQGTDEEEPPLKPWPLQARALAALRAAREEGRAKALLVLATGLGKTLVAAMDVRQVAEELGRPPKVLFLAHRVELLVQAKQTFRRQLQGLETTFGLVVGADLDADMVFASVAKLGRERDGGARVVAYAPERFDVVIVDEVHHATATTYGRILDHLQPKFLLGLTATPERADQGDVLGLFDDFVVFEAGIPEGIEAGHLIPFHYLGLRDVVDYAPIPWRNRRFDPAELARAVQTEARYKRLWKAWEEHPGARTLVFCCSIEHARFTGQWLERQQVPTRVVHSQPDSDDRQQALDDLRAGAVQAICTVDLFNEGVDVPEIDRVVFLRPTESPVVFLQQLGRGLRVHGDVERLTVIDFVGNHRMFLDRLRRVFALAGAPAANLRDVLDRVTPGELPSGCSVDVQLDVIDMLRELLPAQTEDRVLAAYRELRARHDQRPTIGALYRMGYNPATLRAFSGWFEVVRAEGDLTDLEARVLDLHASFFQTLERATSSQSVLDVLVLEALLDSDDHWQAVPLDQHASRLRWRVGASATLRARVGDPSDWLDATLPRAVGWTLDAESVRLGLEVPEACRETAEEMLRELVDYRLARLHRTHTAPPTAAGGFTCRLIRNQKGPVLKLPDRAQHPNLPDGEVDVRLPNGAVWQFRFVSIAINVARPVGSTKNQLPELLREWFGPTAGEPGTTFHVRFSRSPDGWWIEPLGESVATGLRVGAVVNDPQAAFTDGRAVLTLSGTQSLARYDQVALQRGAPETDVEVFGEVDGAWRYLGRGQWDAEAQRHTIPEVDFTTWRALGAGRSASRALPEQDLEAARQWVDRLTAGELPRWVEARGKRCRVLGRSSKGGVRIDGGPDGFQPRSVSLLDLGWVCCARRQSDGSTNEVAVNRLRYLEGTPKGSTRYIDTGWALVLTEPPPH